METITYETLAKRLNAVKLFNKAPELDENIYDGLENGSLYDYEGECEWVVNNASTPSWVCNTNMYDGTGDYPATGEHPDECDFKENAEPREIYQWYLIDQSDAEYMKNNTDELIFYSSVLDEYIWGVTHYGTPWSGVELQFGPKNEQ